MKTSDNANILSTDEVLLRLDRIRDLMKINNTDALLISDNANLFYLTGRVFTGYVYITTETIHYFIRRPIGMTGNNVVYSRKIEDLSTAITDA